MVYRNILLVDDDVEDHEIFNAALTTASNSANCMAITNAIEAFDKLDRKELKPDVIFLDVNMPFMNGLDFLKKIKATKHLEPIHVIMFSTSANPATISAAKELGAIKFITKPRGFDDLVNVLKPLISHS
jgi:DNA-binding NtrC family response regulator